MDRNGLNSNNENKIRDFNQIMQEADVSLHKSFSTPDTPVKYKKLVQQKEKNISRKATGKYLHTTSDIDFKLNELQNFKLSHMTSKDENYFNTTPLIQNKTISKTHLSTKIHLIKSRYLILVSLIFMSLSVLFLKIIFHSHYGLPYSNRSNNNNFNETKFSHHNTISFFLGFYLTIFSIFFIKVDRVDFTKKNFFNKTEIDYLLIRGLSGFLTIY